MACTDTRMSAFAMFSLPSPSRLAWDKERAEGHVATISGMARVPGDTHRRERLDPVSPEARRPSFPSVLRQRQRGQGLAAMGCLAGEYVLALDGPGSLSSSTLPWASCLPQVHRHGALSAAHQRLGAALRHPDQRAGIPLRPEPMITPDGPATHDGERHAAQRFMAKVRQDHPPRTCLLTAESLRANAPPLATLQAHDGHALLGVKEGAPASLFQQVQVAEHAGRVPEDHRHDRAAGVGHRWRGVHDVPLHASRADGRVKVIEAWASGQAQVHHCSWGTDVRGSTRKVSRLMRAGWARWKRANATCQTRNNQGDTVEHTDGQGEHNRSVVCATSMLLAFVVDHTPPLCGAFCRAVWAQLGSKRLVWERLRAWCSGEHRTSRRALLAALCAGDERPRPILSTDTAAFPPVFLTSSFAHPAIPPRHRPRLPRSRHGPAFPLPSRLFWSPCDRHQGKMADQPPHRSCG